MGKDNKSQVIEIDGQEYVFEDMTAEQQLLVQHTVDLDRKLSNLQFQMDQIRVGKDAFLSLLKTSLNKQPDAEKAE